MQNMGDDVTSYMKAYQDMWDLDSKNNNNEYSIDEDLAKLLDEMKTLETHVSTAMNIVDAFKGELMHVIVKKAEKLLNKKKRNNRKNRRCNENNNKTIHEPESY